MTDPYAAVGWWAVRCAARVAATLYRCQTTAGFCQREKVSLVPSALAKIFFFGWVVFAYLIPSVQLYGDWNPSTERQLTTGSSHTYCNTVVAGGRSPEEIS
jgi:hypothetical protein